MRNSQIAKTFLLGRESITVSSLNVWWVPWSKGSEEEIIDFNVYLSRRKIAVYTQKWDLHFSESVEFVLGEYLYKKIATMFWVMDRFSFQVMGK